jgi:hypothetical protein
MRLLYELLIIGFGIGVWLSARGRRALRVAKRGLPGMAYPQMQVRMKHLAGVLTPARLEELELCPASSLRASFRQAFDSHDVMIVVIEEVMLSQASMDVPVVLSASEERSSRTPAER